MRAKRAEARKKELAIFCNLKHLVQYYRMVYSQTTVWCELIGFHSSKSYCWSSPSQVVIFFYTLWKPLVSQSCTTWQKNRYYRTRSVPPCKSPVITVFQLYVAMQWYLLARWRRSSRGPLALSHAVEVIRSPSLQYCTTFRERFYSATHRLYRHTWIRARAGST